MCLVVYYNAYAKIFFCIKLNTASSLFIIFALPGQYFQVKKITQQNKGGCFFEKHYKHQKMCLFNKILCIGNLRQLGFYYTSLGTACLSA